ncbi:putative RNA-directed DNA polymerase from transposon X-element [Trichonephila clavipes]|uniref:Putative RNA-directed DNA polymerase from transposon X-element n=1 Tax=Trichonephila clavipes TaxID=2585209 RepID=A0A8X6SL70_TRICX|nr:putative RNA-directed DNA polymerase from transposon X-element [Trichonephila clavipes]
MILNHLNQHCLARNIIIPEQHGFVTKCSTVTQLLRVTEMVHTCFQNHQATGMLFVDIAKAFDKIWHDGLISKMMRLGFSDQILKIIHSYLNSREFRAGRCALLLARWIVRSVPLEIVGSSGHKKVPTCVKPGLERPGTPGGERRSKDRAASTCGLHSDSFNVTSRRRRSNCSTNNFQTPCRRPFLNGLTGAIFQQDNARPHTARVAQDFLRHFQFLPCPARSPNLSPVEHAWDQLKRQMPSCHSVHDLEFSAQDLWAHRPQDNIRNEILHKDLKIDPILNYIKNQSKKFFDRLPQIPNQSIRVIPAYDNSVPSSAKRPRAALHHIYHHFPVLKRLRRS